MRGVRLAPWLCAGALAVAAASAAATCIISNDLGWHLKAGEWIAAHLSVPRADPFSFTSAGADWVDHGWLWQIVAWSLHQHLGLAGLAILKLSCAAVIGVLGFAALHRRGFGAHTASIIVVICLAGLRFRLTDRPDTASLALLSLVTFVVLIPSWSRAMRALAAAAVCGFWANVHAGVTLGPVIGGAAALGSLIEGSRALRAKRPAGPLFKRAQSEAMTALASAMGALANPFGYRVFLVPLKLSAALSDPRLVNPEWLPPDVWTFPLFHATLAALLIYCSHAILRRRDPSRWRSLLLVSGTGALALSSARHIGVFFAVLPFAMALLKSGSGESGSSVTPPPVAGGSPHRSAASWAPAWGIAAAMVFPLFPSSITAPPGFSLAPDHFPVAECDYIEAHLDPPRHLYNDVAHGGYVVWRFFPGDRVFIDGRNEVHAPLLAEIAAALDDGRAWGDLLDHHGVAAALVLYRSERIAVAGTVPTSPRSFAALHFPRPKWGLVFWGDVAMVFVKRDSGRNDLLDRDEYRFVHPEDFEYQLDRCRSGDRPLLQGILADLRRRSGEEPRSHRAEDLLRQFEAVRQR